MVDDDDAVEVTSAPFKSYLHNLSQPIPGLSVAGAIVEQYRTPVTELIELDTWIGRPDVEGPVPLVLEVTPYYGGGNPRDAVIGGFGQVGDIFVSRGYAVGISSVRGTGNSGGCFTQGGPDEAHDTAAVIEHLASQPWSNGNVGLMGVSYPGTTPQDVWVEAPPALKAVVPISGISDLYKYNFVNGIPLDIQGFGFNTYYWAIVGLGPAGLSGGAQVLDPAHMATAGAGEVCTDQAEVQEGGVSSTLDGNKDAYWQVRDFYAEAMAEPEKRRPAVFYIHGLQDWNVKPHMMEDWLSMLQASGSPYKVWLGQWGHAWPQGGECVLQDDGTGSACRHDWWEETVVAWFDQFLKGIDTGVLDGPAVQVQDDDGRWRHETHWPPFDTVPHVFHLGAGTLDAAPGGTGSSSYFDARGGLMTLPGDSTVLQAVWRSEPLPVNLTISGQPVFHGNVTATGMRASLVLTLGEETDGQVRYFNYCGQSLNHVSSLASGQGDISDLRQEVEVRCFPQDDVVHAGSRLVLIAAGNTPDGRPSLQPVSDGSTITIEHEGAWLELPVDHSTVYESPQPYDEA
jgi:X-Pro dipeptidyl-peptidase